MQISRRSLVRNIGLGIAGVSVASRALARADGELESESLFVKDRPHPEPAPTGYDRLPLEWYKSATSRLKDRLRPEGIDAILLQRDVNAVYFSGSFRGSGERTTWLMFRMDEDDTAYWFSPGIDRDLITSWWCTENEYYFCYPHAENGFPNKGSVETGPAVGDIGVAMQVAPVEMVGILAKFPSVVIINRTLWSFLRG